LIANGNVIGSLSRGGGMRLGPGDNLLSPMFDSEDGVSDIDNVKARLTVSYRAGYKSLRGTD